MLTRSGPKHARLELQRGIEDPDASERDLHDAGSMQPSFRR